ncbi:MAG: hypothetical protein LUF04_03940 [Bacteroides sp.]|nr:hypothetical protein [Bacteroides sp.]
MKKEFLMFVSVFFITCFQGCTDSTDEYAVYEEKRKKIHQQCEQLFTSIKVTNYLEESHISYDCRRSVDETIQGNEVIQDLVQRITRLLGFAPEVRKDESGEGFTYLWVTGEIYVRLSGRYKDTELFTEILIMNPKISRGEPTSRAMGEEAARN